MPGELIKKHDGVKEDESSRCGCSRCGIESCNFKSASNGGIGNGGVMPSDGCGVDVCWYSKQGCSEYGGDPSIS